MTSHTDEPGFLDDDGPSEDLPAFISAIFKVVVA